MSFTDTDGTATAPTEKLLLSLVAAADRLSVSKSTVLRLIRAGELHPVYVGDRPLLRPSDLQEFIERRRGNQAGNPKIPVFPVDEGSHHASE
jgi:excisionase family DNA binding protein